MASQRQTQVSEELAHLAAQFFARNSNHESLITVTHATVSPDLKNTTIFLSVLPEKFEDSVLLFAKRNCIEFREFIKTSSRMRYLPNVDFEIDYGEKNRQRIDDLTRRS